MAYSGQYIRIQRDAGGIFASNRALIRAARGKLKKSGLTRHKRKARHYWLRDLIAIHQNQQKKYIDNRL